MVGSRSGRTRDSTYYTQDNGRAVLSCSDGNLSSSTNCIPHLERYWDTKRGSQRTLSMDMGTILQKERILYPTPPIMCLSLKIAYHLRCKLSSNNSDQSWEDTCCCSPEALGVEQDDYSAGFIVQGKFLKNVLADEARIRTFCKVSASYNYNIDKWLLYF